MKVIAFVNSLGLGGTEKAACRWAWGLQERGHEVLMLTLRDGPRQAELAARGVKVRVEASAAGIAGVMREFNPDVIHAHAPGHAHPGDRLGEALAGLPKIPVVQTNIFGQLLNPAEDAWTDFRLYISWTSCVQAARRSFQPLNQQFFRRAGVAVYPLDSVESAPTAEIAAFRHRYGIADGEVLFGRLSRPEPNKWTNLALEAFQLALRGNQGIKLLLREPPPAVAQALRASPAAHHFIILPATVDPDELRLTMSALDGVLHTSLIGESFGYGIAEPMNLGKPVISHSVPWEDQAQIELVRHGECGFIASTPVTMAEAILKLAADKTLREGMGHAAQRHIQAVADPATSIGRLERALAAVMQGKDNAEAAAELQRARATAAYLDAQQFGHGWSEGWALRPWYWRVRFHQWRRYLRTRSRGGV